MSFINRHRPTFIVSALALLVSTTWFACGGHYVTARGSFLYFDSSQSELKSTRSPASVQLFYKREPGKAFTEIGMVEALAQGHNVTLQDLMPELQKQAALMNADGITKIEMQRFETGAEAFHATAVAIRFGSGPAPRVPASAKPAKK